MVQKIGSTGNKQEQSDVSDEQLKSSRVPVLGGDLDTYASRTLLGAAVRDKVVTQMSDENKVVDAEQHQRTLKARAMVGSNWYDVAPVIKGNMRMQLSSSMFGANLNVPINVSFNIVSIGKGIPLFGMRIPNLRLESKLHRTLQENIEKISPCIYTWWSELPSDSAMSTRNIVDSLRARFNSLKSTLAFHIQCSVPACLRDPTFIDKWNSIAKNTSLAINSFDPQELDPIWVTNQCEYYANAIVTFYMMMEAARKEDLSITNLHEFGFDLRVSDDRDKTLEILKNVTEKTINVLGNKITDVGFARASIMQYFVPEYTAMVWWSNMMSGVEFSGFEVMRLFSEIEVRRIHQATQRVNVYHSLHSKVEGVDKVVIPKGACEFELNLRTNNEKVSRRQVDDPHCFVQYVEVNDCNDDDRNYVMNLPNHIIVSPTIMVHGTQTAVVCKSGLGLHIRRHLSPFCTIMTSAIIRNGCLHIEYGDGTVGSGYLQSDMVSVYQTLIPKIFADTFDSLKPNPIGGWNFNSQYREWRPQTRTIARSGQNYVYTSDTPQPIFLDVESKCAHAFPALLDPAFASHVITLYMEWYNKIIDKKISVIVDNETLAIEDVIAKSEKGKYYSCSRMLLLAVILNCSIGVMSFDFTDEVGDDPSDFSQEITLTTNGTTLLIKK